MTYRGRPKNEDRTEYRKEYYQKTKRNRDRLFVILSNPDARLILKLMKKGEVCTYTQMLNGFGIKDSKVEKTDSQGMTNKFYGKTYKKSGLFAHNIRNLVELKVIIKDRETGFYWLTLAGKLALKGALILEKALDEKTLNDVNKQGKLVMKIVR